MATQVNLTLTFSEVYFLSKDAWFTFIGNVKHHLIKHIIFNPYNLSFIFETFALQGSLSVTYEISVIRQKSLKLILFGMFVSWKRFFPLWIVPSIITSRKVFMFYSNYRKFQLGGTKRLVSEFHQRTRYCQQQKILYDFIVL